MINSWPNGFMSCIKVVQTKHGHRVRSLPEPNINRVLRDFGPRARNILWV